METYFKTSKNLKTADRRANSVEPVSRSNVDTLQKSLQLEPVIPEQRKKIVYKHEIEEITKKISEADNKRVELDSQLKEVVKAVETLKNNDDVSKMDKVKLKLDNFINSYNENELAHSEELKNLKNDIDKINQRLVSVEEIL